jgi:hypothetical protein
MRTPLASNTDRTKFPTTTTPQSSAPGYTISMMVTCLLEGVKRRGFAFAGVMINASDTIPHQAGQPERLHAARASRTYFRHISNKLIRYNTDSHPRS